MGNEKWFMLNLVGKDRKDVIAHVTTALHEGGCYLGESSMVCKTGVFGMMMMVEYQGTCHALEQLVEGVAESMGLSLNIVPINRKHNYDSIPDVRISVYDANDSNIIAKVTTALAEVGFHIRDLSSDISSAANEKMYVMHIDGVAWEGTESIKATVDILKKEGLGVHMELLDNLDKD